MKAGYSGTPLWKKLGLASNMPACVIDPPDTYLTDLLNGGPAVNWGPLADGVAFVHLFTTKASHLATTLETCLPLIARDGMIWVSWPKKASKIPTDITEDTIREICLPMGLVDVKVCAVDQTWSGLKLVIRKKLR